MKSPEQLSHYMLPVSIRLKKKKKKNSTAIFSCSNGDINKDQDPYPQKEMRKHGLQSV